MSGGRLASGRTRYKPAMRVAVVCPNYTQGRSYQENIWAEQLAKSGHAVRVIYSGKVDRPGKQIAAANVPYETRQVRTRHLPRGTFQAPNAHLAVREFNPDLIVVCGDKLFAMPIVRDPQLAGVPLICTYSEHLGLHEFDWRKPGITLKQRAWAIGFRLLRGGPIRAVCRRSQVVVGNTPHGRKILERLFSTSEWPRIDARMVDMPLGFSPDHFGYLPDLRQSVRDELGIAPSDVLVCVSSHFAAAKLPYVTMIVDALREAMKREPACRAVIVGFDPLRYKEITAQVTRHIDSGPHADRFIKHPFADRSRLCELYNASDIAVFGRASISCQEALGTGLCVCFPEDGSLNHLVTLPDQGVFFRPGDVSDLAAKIVQMVKIVTEHQGARREAFRYRLADAAAWLGYDRIIASVLQRLEPPRQGNRRAPIR